MYVCELGNMSCQRVMSLQLPHIAKDTPHVMPFPPSGREWARAVKNAVVSAHYACFDYAGESHQHHLNATCMHAAGVRSDEIDLFGSV